MWIRNQGKECACMCGEGRDEGKGRGVVVLGKRQSFKASDHSPWKHYTTTTEQLRSNTKGAQNHTLSGCHASTGRMARVFYAQQSAIDDTA